MIFEYFQECISFVIATAFCIDFSVGVIEKRKNIHSTIAYIFKLLDTFPGFLCLHIRSKPLEYLYTRTLVKKKQIAGRVFKECHKMFHFREKIGIGYVQEIS